MSVENDPPERDVKDYKFQQLCKVQVRDPTGPDEFKGYYALIESSSKYSLTFVGVNKGFKVIRTQEFVSQDANHTSDRLQYVIPDIPTVAVVDIGQPVTHLAVSCDGLTLAVVVKSPDRSCLNIYDVRRFAEPIAAPVTPFLSINLGGGEQVSVLDMAWNPALPTLLVTCLSNGRLDMFNITDKLEIKANLPTAKAKCVCWSPKGKQMVAGTEDGKLIQFDPDLRVKRVWDCPPLFPDQSFAAVSIVWLSTYTFLVGYLSSNADSSDQPNLILINGSKDGPTTHQNFEDICFGTGEERPKKYFFNFIQQWDMVITGSSNASEMSIMAKHLDQKQFWERWNLDDSARAECPLTEDYVDTFPLGMTVDFSSQTAISLGDERVHPPSPLMLILSTAGYIIPYHCMYMHKNAPQITAAAAQLSNTGCRQSSGGSAAAQTAPQTFGGSSTAAKNLFGTSTISSKPLFGAVSQPSGTDTTAKPSFGAALGGQTETKSPISGFGLGAGLSEGQPAFGAKLPAVSGQSESKPPLFGGTGSGSFSFVAPSSSKASGFSGFTAPQTSTPFSTNGASSKSSGFGSFTGFASSGAPAVSTPATAQASSTGLQMTSGQTTGFTGQGTAPVQSFGFGTALGQSAGSGSTPFTVKPTNLLVADAVTPFSTSSMMAPGSFNFQTNPPGQATGFNVSTPAATVPGSKPASVPPQPAPSQPAPSQPAPTQPAQSNLFAKPVPGFQSAPIGSAPAQSAGSSMLSGGFAGAATGSAGLLPTPPKSQLHKSATLSSLAQSSEPVSKAPVTGLAPNAQTQAPPPPYTSSVRSSSVSGRDAPTPTEGENNVAETVDKAYANSIQEEIQHFEKEMAELRSRVGKVDYQIGSKEEMIQLKTKTVEMGKFRDEIKMTVQEQNKDVEEQTTLCLDMFAMVGECRVRQQLNSDPKYKTRLKSKALDSASAEKLQELQLQNQTLDQGLRDVDHILDSHWDEYQNRKKNKSRRVQAPTNDAIYRVVKSNHNLIVAQQCKLKEVEENLKQLKLYNKTSTWNNSGMTNHSTGDRFDVLSSLADSLVESGPNASQSSQRSPSPQRSSEDGSFRSNKLTQLRDHLYRRHVPVTRSTKPENLSLSRLTAPNLSFTSTVPKSQEPAKVAPTERARPAPVREQVPATFMGQPTRGAITGKREQPPVSQPANPLVTTQKTASSGGVKRNAGAGQSTQTFTQQQATRTAAPFNFNAAQSTGQTFQGFGMGAGAKGTASPQLTVPRLKEINGIILEDITPSGSDNEVETTEEEGEYDEEEDSSGSNDQGFGLKYSMPEHNSAGPQTTSTPVTVRHPSEDVPTPKAGIGSTPISRKLFSQEDTQPAGGGGTFQAAGFGLGKATASSNTGSLSFGNGAASAGNKSAATGFSFASKPSVNTETATGNQPNAGTDTGFKFGEGPGFSFGTSSSDTKPSTGLTGLFGNKSSGTTSTGSTSTGGGDGKAFSLSALASATSTPGSAASSSPQVVTTSASSVTGSDTLTGSTSDRTSSSFGTTTAASVAGFAGVGFGLGSSSTTSQPSASNATFGSATATTQPASSSSSPASGHDVKATAPSAGLPMTATSTGLFGKGATPAGSSAASSSVFGQPSSATSDAKPSTAQIGSTPRTGSGVFAQPSSAGVSQPGATTQSSGFSFSQPGATTSSFSFGPSGATAQSSTPGFGQTATTSNGGSVGFFGKPTTSSTDSGSLFGQATTNSSLFGGQSSSPSFGQTATTSSTGLFGGTTTTTTSTGLFGTTTATPSTGLFGATSTTTSSTGLFGSKTTTPSTGLFGATPTSGAGTGLFGAAPTSGTGLFGATQTSGTGMFGATPTSGTGLFGATPTSGTGLFGATPTSSTGLFGATPTSGTGLFGPTQTSGTGLFGTNSTSGTGSFGTTSTSGAGAFGSTPSSGFGQTSFGQSPSFGQSTSSGSTFGQTGSSSGGLFGQATSEGSSGGLFAGLGGKPSAEKANSNVFGGGTFGSQTQPSGTGLFGSSSTSTFGSAANQGGSGSFTAGAGVGSTGFGSTQQPSSGGGFGSAGFGAAPAFGGSPGFGTSPRFGSTPAFGGGGFGAQPTFGTASPVGGNTFGSATQNQAAGFAGFASAGSPTFGALAQSSDAPTFGALNNSGTAGGGGFGSPSFGAAQQSQQSPPAFGGASFGGSPQFTGYRG